MLVHSLMADIEIYVSLLLVGLLGSTHCIGMCGGLQQLFINMSPSQHKSILPIYHIGRLVGYSVITLLVATVLSRFAAQTAGLVPYATGIRLLAAVVIIWIGVSHFIRLPLPATFRIATDKLWQVLRGVAKPFLPPRNRWHVFFVGVVWGWLPCSLVYTALAIALSADTVVGSVIAMLCFGIGTVPALLGMGVLTRHFQTNPAMKQWLAVALIFIGFYALISVFYA